MHVLLVEDSAINRRFIGLALSKAGIELSCAENGRLGVEMATAGQYDAILMDMQMPVMDGFEATARLRQLGLTTPIIALTGHATEADRQRCLQAGCTDHLTKPLDAEKLTHVLTRLVADVPPPDFAEDSQDFSLELRQIALDYLDVQRQRIHEMNESLEKADYQHLAELAHRMKGTAGTVGFPEFTAPAKRLETAAISVDQQACSTTLEEIATLQAEAQTQSSKSLK
jgi:CheY-like chemotaxis protein